MNEINQRLPLNTLSLQNNSILNTYKFLAKVTKVFKNNSSYDNTILGGIIQVSIATAKKLLNNIHINTITQGFFRFIHTLFLVIIWEF